jgi:hypothetical protein
LTHYYELEQSLAEIKHAIIPEAKSHRSEYAKEEKSNTPLLELKNARIT